MRKSDDLCIICGERCVPGKGTGIDYNEQTGEWMHLGCLRKKQRAKRKKGKK